jgi:transposase
VLIFGFLCELASGFEELLLAGLRPQALLLAGSRLRRGRGQNLVAQQKGAWANIPPRRNCEEPISASPHLSRARNFVERFFNKIRQCRRVATRYAKLAANDLAFVKLAAIRLACALYEFIA